MASKNKKIISKDILKAVENPPFVYNAADYGFSKKMTGRGVKIGIISTGKPIHNDILNIGDCENFCEKSKGIEDKNGIATSLGGVISSSSDQIIGIAKDGQLCFVKAYNDANDGVESSLVSSILWLIIKRVDVIAISNVLDYESITLQDAISKAYDSNICLFSYNTDDDNFPEILGIHRDLEEREKCNFTLKLEERECFTVYGKDKYIRTPYEVYFLGVVAGLSALIIEDKKTLKEKYTPRDIYSELVKKVNKK